MLDIQSVVAHCGGLWSAALRSGPGQLSNEDKKRLKERVVKLAHSSIK